MLVALTIVLLVLSAYTTNAIGIHDVFGAFLMEVIKAECSFTQGTLRIFWLKERFSSKMRVLYISRYAHPNGTPGDIFSSLKEHVSIA